MEQDSNQNIYNILEKRNYFMKNELFNINENYKTEFKDYYL